MPVTIAETRNAGDIGNIHKVRNEAVGAYFKESKLMDACHDSFRASLNNYKPAMVCNRDGSRWYTSNGRS